MQFYKGAYDLSRGKLNSIRRENDSQKVIVTTRSHMTDLIKRDLETIPNSKLVHYGGAGYKVRTQDKNVHISLIINRCKTDLILENFLKNDILSVYLHYFFCIVITKL